MTLPIVEIPDELKHLGILKLLDKGIVSEVTTTVSLLGIELLGIDTRKITASLDTWIEYTLLSNI